MNTLTRVCKTCCAEKELIVENFYFVKTRNRFQAHCRECVKRKISEKQKNYKKPRYICKEPNCDKTAYYGYNKQSGFEYCRKHKKNNMYPLNNQCEFESCTITAAYSFKGKRPIRCAKHRLEGMTCFKKYCQEEGCGLTASFGFKNKPASYCSVHKHNGMIYKGKGICEHEDCNNPSDYAYLDERTARYCKEHKKPSMIRIQAIRERCTKKPCSKLSTYGYPNQKATRCKDHFEPGMIRKKSCKHENCNKIPHFNFPGSKGASYCYAHQLLGMINIRLKKCIQIGCDTPASTSKKCQGYCLRCFLYNFPDEQVTKKFKIKEKHITDDLKAFFEIIDIQATFNKRIKSDLHMDDCGQISKRRPDVLIDLGTHSIIIEVDENQHCNTKNYNCETKRILEIFQDLGMRSLIVLRFNPDSYINSKGNKVSSCFKYHKANEIPIIADKKIYENRLNTLKSILTKYIKAAQNNEVPTRELTTINLYYDGYDDTNQLCNEISNMTLENQEQEAAEAEESNNQYQYISDESEYEYSDLEDEDFDDEDEYFEDEDFEIDEFATGELSNINEDNTEFVEKPTLDKKGKGKIKA